MAVVLLSHGLPGMFDGGVNAFGEFFLTKFGFAPAGIPLAWTIKISHVVCAVLLLLNKYAKPASLVIIFILLMEIILVHWNELLLLVINYYCNGVHIFVA